MSLVTIVAKKNYINVLSDGLVVNFETKEEKDQNYQKFNLISKDQFIAFAGNQGVCEKAVEVTGYHDERVNLKQLANELQSEIYNVPFEDASVLLAVGGISPEGEIEFYTFSNNPNQEMLSYKPIGDNTAYAILHNSLEDGEIDLETKFEDYLRRTGHKNSNRAFEAQILLNNFVAENDYGVNKKVFKLKITK